MSSRPRVQFVSKPICEPFRDGSKCLVRDVALSLRDFDPEVLGVRSVEPELPGVVVRPVYSAAGTYAPSLVQNLRAAAWLLTRSRASVWHFVFAPNPRTSQVGRGLKALRRIPVVQTIASPPLNFERPANLLFGDVAVAQSRDTLERFRASAEREGVRLPRLVEIPPPAPLLAPIAPERVAAARAEFRIPDGAPLVLYPGDLDLSGGGGAVRELVLALEARSPHEGAQPVVVFAYRDKTDQAVTRANALGEGLDPERVRFVRNAPDIHALVAASSVVVFPVVDLYGKVDLPIILLEAFRLGVPVLAEQRGPLGSLVGAERLPFEPTGWAEWLTGVFGDEGRWRAQVAFGTQALARYEPAVIGRAYEGIYRELLGNPDPG